MASSNRQANLSPREWQRAKSRQSSAYSHRTTPNAGQYDDRSQSEKSASRTSKRKTRELSATKRSESSTSNRSATATSPTSNTSRKLKSSLKSSPSPPAHRKSSSKRSRSILSTHENERGGKTEENDAEKQDLSGQGLSGVPSTIFDLSTLRQLNLSNNNISTIPSGIRSLVNLEYFNISHNPLIVKNGRDDYSCFPNEFLHLKKLRILILSECALKHIPVVIWSLLSLEILDLSRNKVGFIVSEIGNLVDIRHLRLSQMDLDSLPPEIGFCNKLETLDLTGNPIDNVPETLIECRQLYELKISYSTFYKLLDTYMLQLIDEGKIRSEYIPQVIFELENLRVLDLRKTKINYLPKEQMLLNLTELYLSHNSFFDIPETICSIEKLKIIDMSHNRIYAIPECFIKLKQLEIVNLSHNKLISVTKLFSYLPILKKLVLNHNKIDSIEEEFSKSKSLLILDLSFNQLSTITNELCQLKQLETLDLRYNKITTIPSIIRSITGLKTMNIFSKLFQRSGLHLLGNSITEPPSFIWKSTNIQTLFDYIEKKEKKSIAYYFHLKMIFIGSKNVGKTTLAMKILNNRNNIEHTRNTIDMYVSKIQEKQINNDQIEQEQPMSNYSSSSGLADQWIENRITTAVDFNEKPKVQPRRVHPPPLKTYRSNDIYNYILRKSTVTTRNNFYFTIFDLTNEPSFEILYPLIYDSNSLYILPVNLTNLLNISHDESNLEDDHLNTDQLLTNEWMHKNIFHYLESISDYSERLSIAILGLFDSDQITVNKQDQVLNEIHLKVAEYLENSINRKRNIKVYSEFFPKPIDLNNDSISLNIIEQLESLAREWNTVYHKQMRTYIKQRLRFPNTNELFVNYNAYLKKFEQEISFSLTSNESDENVKEIKKVIEDEIKKMSFDQCLNYLKLTGDILCIGQKSQKLIVIRPYYLLNQLLSNTLFRPQMEKWLNYDENLIFQFSGYYPTQNSFAIDRQCLLNRGEFSWKLLNILFHEQDNNNINSLAERNIIDLCRLMERLYLGYLNESNTNYDEFVATSFVCPWFVNEKCASIDYINYFKSLERKRQYENLRCARTRRIKQQQLWFSIDAEQINAENTTLSQINQMNLVQNETTQYFSYTIPDLPSIEHIKISDDQVLSQDLTENLIIQCDSNNFPSDFYQCLLISLHSLFDERLDYCNLTLGRTIDKALILVQHFNDQNRIQLTINPIIRETIVNTLTQKLFSRYPIRNFRIET